MDAKRASQLLLLHLCSVLLLIGKPFSLYSTSSLPCGIAPMAQFHTHPFLVVILCSSTYSHFISTIVFAASDIFRKGTSCVANAKLGIMDAFQKIFLYVPCIQSVFFASDLSFCLPTPLRGGKISLGQAERLPKIGKINNRV